MICETPPEGTAAARRAGAHAGHGWTGGDDAQRARGLPGARVSADVYAWAHLARARDPAAWGPIADGLPSEPTSTRRNDLRSGDDDPGRFRPLCGRPRRHRPGWPRGDDQSVDQFP